MTPLPKRRWSTRRQGLKRASQKVSLTKSLIKREKCPNCDSELKIRHRVCLVCGFYKGKQTIIIKQKKTKKTKQVEN